MSDTFKEECPAIDYNCTDITDILPLVSVYIDASEIKTEADTSETRSIAVSDFAPIALPTVTNIDDFRIRTELADWQNIEFSGKAGYKLATSYNEYIINTKKLKEKVKNCKKINIGFLSKEITNNKLGLGNSDAGNLTFADIDIEKPEIMNPTEFMERFL